LARPGTPSRALTAEILAVLDSAATLNPDRQIALLRAEAEQRGGNDAAALRIAKGVVAAEPENVFAWLEVAYTAVGHPDIIRFAQARERQLVPPVPAAP